MPPTNPKRGTAREFANLFDMALQHRGSTQRQKEVAVDLGLEPILLLRYAAGCLPDANRMDVEQTLAWNAWALSRVVAITKAARTNERVANLLDAVRNDKLDVTAGIQAELTELLEKL